MRYRRVAAWPELERVVVVAGGRAGVDHCADLLAAAREERPVARAFRWRPSAATASSCIDRMHVAMLTSVGASAATVVFVISLGPQ